jgi:hypothetical protein
LLQAVPLSEQGVSVCVWAGLALTVDLPILGQKVSWPQLESLMVGLGHRAPAEVLSLVLDEVQKLLVERVSGSFADARGAEVLESLRRLIEDFFATVQED